MTATIHAIKDEPTVEDEISAFTRAYEKVCASPAFIRRGRNPALASPDRFEPTVKRDGDVVI